ITRSRSKDPNAIPVLFSEQLINKSKAVKNINFLANIIFSLIIIPITEIAMACPNGSDWYNDP
ncbi:hypothetical protein, partial [Staphylococcus aureus]|uniref:hypothetical protein n=1 Tax=Staphylococcus aureus TaxID=1280 RepID=UPI00301CC876